MLGLVRMGQGHLLAALYGEVILPEAVDREIRRGALLSGHLEDYEAVNGIDVVGAPPEPVGSADVLSRLDEGEREALALCLSFPRTLLLIDEKAGRRAAAALGLPHTGLLGILIRAYRRELIGDFREDLDRLRVDYGFRLSDALVARVYVDLGLV